MKLKAYGCRASIPFYNREGARFGGNTSCFRLDMNGRIIIFDCGTGIMQFHADMLKERADGLRDGGLTFDILLSHLHLDHIIGLSMFDFLFDSSNNMRIYTKSRSDLPVATQVFGIFRPPYWPVDIAEMSRAEIIEIMGNDVFALGGDITVTTYDAMHDNDTTGFRVQGEKTVVYLLDYEITKDNDDLNKLAEFCKNADIVVFDATYLPEDYPPRRGWGHSTFESGVLLAELSHCKRMVFSHFYHIYSDVTLDSVVKRINGGNTEYIMAYDGMELEI